MTAASPPPETIARLMRALPSMGAVLDAFAGSASQEGDAATVALCIALHARTPRPLLRDAIDDFLVAQRTAIRQGLVTDAQSLSLRALLPGMARHAVTHAAPHLCRVINATGVIVHTNLGRSLLAEEAITAVAEVACNYSTLEFDCETGGRGSRQSHIEHLVRRLTGAEAALAVNNNAAAVLLVLDTLCKGREVIVSRGELVEIGGSFRIPAVMEKSGCLLREVGATNRTHRRDYAEAITGETAALMKVHTSNYKIIGFTAEVARSDLAELAHDRGLPLIEDLGSGLLLDMAALGAPVLAGEPVVRRVLGEGVDIVTFSGDKVLGGPQAGIIAGRASLVERIRKNPLHRAVRIDKLSLAALEATLRLCVDPDLAKARIPTIRMLCMSEWELRRMADALASLLARVAGLTVTVRAGESRVGGGAFPEMGLPTHLVCLAHVSLSPQALQRSLVAAHPPVLARVEQDSLCFDPRTLHQDELPQIAMAVAALQCDP